MSRTQIESMKYLTLIFTFISLLVQAQEETDLSFPLAHEYIEKTHAYLLADEVNLRDCASKDCEKIAVLSIGSKLTLLERSEAIETINGIRSNWYKVDSGQAKGWVWGGLIATYSFGSYMDPTIKFVAGLEKKTEEGYYCQIRAIRDEEEVSRISIKSFAHEIGWIKNIGKMGMENIDDVIHIEIPCVGGCGCTAGNVVVFWDGAKLHFVDNLMGTADGNYSEYVDFIYPADMEGRKGILIKQIMTYEDPDQQPEGKLTRVYIEHFFTWKNGKLMDAGIESIVQKTVIDLKD